ncbi:hypothetical protein [Desulforhopalus singaporensis]|uniref:Uncharacterized protein n=1 Tax=Desulforhopalus singaporensis TaxID=91360 RepID=A0A1H0U5D3_9BACT|nr:hypothetical protein [Desulforhopalus singaporensis]SDP61393.1 hypothetical protein SAMN05660330_03386 [Desulforhopalus singaporensis]
MSKTLVSRNAFGGILHKDSNGFYTALEFFSILTACSRAGDGFLPSMDEKEEITCLHRSLDYARKIAWPPQNEYEELDYKDCFKFDSETQDTIKTVSNMLKAIAVPVPGRRKEAHWQSSHFLPYGEVLTHWDARPQGKTNKVSIREIYFRGTGALIFKILRSDPNKKRLNNIREGLEKIMGGDGLDALTTIVGELANHDLAKGDDQSLQVNEKEKNHSFIIGDKYEENIRQCAFNILSHDEAPRTTKIDALLYFLPFAMLRLQHGRAFNRIGNGNGPIVLVDCGFKPGQLRNQSKKSLDNAQSLILQALLQIDEELFRKDDDEDYKNPRKTLKEHFAAYYTRTASAVGLLNAHTGVRHYVLKDSIIEALVLAATGGGKELTYKNFCSWLYDTWGLVIDIHSAQKAQLLSRLDGSIFDDNSKFFSDHLKRLGFLHDYSDMTVFVRYGF